MKRALVGGSKASMALLKAIREAREESTNKLQVELAKLRSSDTVTKEEDVRRVPED